jgi:hypothetical protein
MTQFHTDEYIEFLSRVTPTNAKHLQAQGYRCNPPSLLPLPQRV